MCEKFILQNRSFDFNTALMCYPLILLLQRGAANVIEASNVHALIILQYLGMSTHCNA